MTNGKYDALDLTKNDVKDAPVERLVMSTELERCPQCNSWEGLKFPRGLEPYCEDCGWTDENFGDDDDVCK